MKVIYRIEIPLADIIARAKNAAKAQKVDKDFEVNNIALDRENLVIDIIEVNNAKAKS